MSARDYLAEANRNPSDWLIFREMFIREGASNVPDTMSFEVVKDASASTVCEADKAGGVLLMSSQATTDNDGNLVQSLNEFYLPASGKRMGFRVWAKASDADQHDMFIGLAQRAATDPEATLAVSNRVGFQIDDGNASILLKCEAADIEVSKDSEQDQADDTYAEFGISYNGSGQYSFQIDGNNVGSISSNLPATEMLVALFNLSGNATGTHTARFKRLEVCIEL